MFSQACVCPQGEVCLVRGGVCSGGSGPGGMPGLGVCSGGVPGPGGLLRGLVSQHALRRTPPGEMATAADGTHPTGMHSNL